MCDARLLRQLSSLPLLLLYSSVLLGHGVTAQDEDSSGGVVKDASISSLFSSSLSPEMGTAPPYEDGEPQVKLDIVLFKKKTFKSLVLESCNLYFLCLLRPYFFNQLFLINTINVYV